MDVPAVESTPRDIDVGILVVEVPRRRRAAALEGDPGSQARQVIDAAQSLDVQLLLGECRGAHRNVLQTLGAARCRHDDFLQAAARGSRCCRSARISIGAQRVTGENGIPPIRERRRAR